jgi:hypothetical protein
MVLRLLSPSEIGVRVALVRRMAGFGSQRQLRIALGSSDNNLVNDIEAGTKKIVDYHRLGFIAEVCEGRGQLEGVPAQEILDYMIGRVDWDLRPRAVQEAASHDAGNDSEHSGGGIRGDMQMWPLSRENEAA